MSQARRAISEIYETVGRVAEAALELSSAARPKPRSHDFLSTFFLAECKDAEEAKKALLRFGMEELGAELGCLISASDEHYSVETAVGGTGWLERSRVLAARLRADHLSAQSGATAEPRFVESRAGPEVREAGIGSYVAVPLRCGSKRYVLAFAWKESGPLSEGDRSYVALLAAFLRSFMIKPKLPQDQTVVFQDSLTGLPNRAASMVRLEEELCRAERHDMSCGVAFIDMDGFGRVNDAFGHDAGDQVLAECAQRIKSTLRRGEFLGRLGGDEFLLIVPNASNRDELNILATRIIDIVSIPFPYRNEFLKLGVSCGISLYPIDGSTAKDLLTNADTAMYRAKRSGGSTACWFSAEIGKEINERRQLTQQLRTAFTDKEFLLCYQPIVAPLTGELIAIEALLRWLHPELGLLSPLRFLGDDEAIISLSALNVWVAREALREAGRLRELRKGVSIAINLSTVDMVTLANLRRTLQEEQTETGLLTIELDLAAVVRDVSKSLEFIDNCKAIGIKVAIDRFGDSPVSLSVLGRLKIDYVKIDVSEITSEDAKMEAAAVSMRIAQAFGWRIIAKAVETESQRKWLAQFGVVGIQGYHIAHPMTTIEFERWLQLRLLRK